MVAFINYLPTMHVLFYQLVELGHSFLNMHLYYRNGSFQYKLRATLKAVVTFSIFFSDKKNEIA